MLKKYMFLLLSSTHHPKVSDTEKEREREKALKYERL
jgi:hypothetical protein